MVTALIWSDMFSHFLTYWHTSHFPGSSHDTGVLDNMSEVNNNFPGLCLSSTGKAESPVKNNESLTEVDRAPLCDLAQARTVGLLSV